MFPLDFQGLTIIDPKLWCRSHQPQRPGEKSEHESKSKCPATKQLAWCQRNTHVLPSNPAYIPWAKSNHSNSLQAFYLPRGRLKLCCQLKKKRASSHCPTTLGRDGKRPVCRTGTLKFQMEKAMRSCRLLRSPAQGSSRRRQCYHPSCKAHEKDAGLVWTHRQVLKAPLPPADSDITHTCAVVSGKDGTVR